MSNCTRHGNFTNTMRQANRLPVGFAVSIFTLNILLSIIASLGNALILFALHKVRVSHLHPPTKLLFQCLAVTDLCVGFILQSLFAILSANDVLEINFPFSIYQALYTSSFMLCGVSILTSTTISVDRLLVLLLGPKYRHVVTLRRVRVLIIWFWLSGVSCGLMYSFWSHGMRVVFSAAVAAVIKSIIISVFSYTKIFFTLRSRQHQLHAQDHVNQEQANGRRDILNQRLNIALYKKTVSSIAWVQLALVVCYIPFVISIVTIRINGWNGMTADIVWITTGTLLYLNSSLNPILYCWKIKQVRKFVKNIIGQFCCLCWAENSVVE